VSLRGHWYHLPGGSKGFVLLQVCWVGATGSYFPADHELLGWIDAASTDYRPALGRNSVPQKCMSSFCCH
jgi:hypothetical protein